MNIDIDVSGEDILSPQYTICIANNDGLIKGFKMSKEYVSILHARYGQGLYRYKRSKKDRTNFKIRLYCVIIYYLFTSLSLKEKLSLQVCRDFKGKERDITTQLNYFLKEKLGLLITKTQFTRLAANSQADQYAYLMRRDTKNKLATYVKITLEEIETFLVKK